MTKLTGSNPVAPETAVSDRGRAIIIELYPSHLALRLKGLRQSHFVAYDSLLWRVMKNAAERIVSERLAKRTGRRKVNRNRPDMFQALSSSHRITAVNGHRFGTATGWVD